MIGSGWHHQESGPRRPGGRIPLISLRPEQPDRETGRMRPRPALALRGVHPLGFGLRTVTLGEQTGAGLGRWCRARLVGTLGTGTCRPLRLGKSRSRNRRKQ